ncbi:MAG: UPF0182 family protein [Acidimicrobiia bacterium]|nr:UPF0182 family protein [Acidimicrobiia bacterium]
MRRRRVIVLIALAVVVLVVVIVGPGVSFYTDLLWYTDTGYRDLYTTQLSYQITLFLASAAAFAAILGVNVYLARKLSPLRPLAITNDFLFNLRRSLDPVLRFVLVGVVIVGAIGFGTATYPSWSEFLLWNHAQPFDAVDPVFGKNVGFYVFSLPIWKFAFGWMLATLIITLLIVAAVYAYAGAIGPQPEGGILAPAARNHISILLGLLLLLKAVGYQINQWELLYSERGTVLGASYTDVNAQLPAYRVLFWIAIISAVLLFATFLTKRLLLPIVAIALMVVAAFVVGGVYPRLVQQFEVVPNEIEKESPYIAQNIEFTRQGYNLDAITQQNFPYSENLTSAELQDNEQVLANVRLWDDKPLLDTYKQTQELVPYYLFNSIGVDRYPISNRDTQVLISAREVDPTALAEAARTWQNIHLVYTHGFGAVVSPANEETTVGGPSYLVKDVPPDTAKRAQPALDIAEPRIYFGQQTKQFVIVNTNLSELDRPVDDTTPSDDSTTVDPATGQQVEAYSYQGESGVQLNSIWRKLAYAIRFRDTKFVLSSAITPESRLLYDRDLITRLKKVAPFLTYDTNPYLSVVDGRLQWIVDGYTSTDLYPYSEPVRVPTALRETLGGFAGVNYMRNSVKATVDAYTGEVTLYRIDENDPIAAAWNEAIPQLFGDAEPSETLRSHFRYPMNLFAVQQAQYGRYHVTDPRSFYSQDDAWDVAQRSTPTQTVTGSNDVPAIPQYLNMKLPGEENVEFVLFNSYTPRGKQNLISLLAARSDPQHYGELVSMVLPRGEVTINGPQQVEARIQQTPEIASELTLLDQRGSRTDRGNVRIVPIATSLLYVQPIYIRADENAVPQLSKVVVLFGNNAKMGDDFASALTALFGFSPVAGPIVEGDAPAIVSQVPPTERQPSTAAPSELAALVTQANSLYQQMQQALTKGDLEAYGKLEKQLGDTLNQLSQSSGGTSAVTTTAPPTTAAAG